MVLSLAGHSWSSRCSPAGAAAATRLAPHDDSRGGVARKPSDAPKVPPCEEAQARMMRDSPSDRGGGEADPEGPSARPPRPQLEELLLRGEDARSAGGGRHPGFQRSGQDHGHDRSPERRQCAGENPRRPAGGHRGAKESHDAGRRHGGHGRGSDGRHHRDRRVRDSLPALQTAIKKSQIEAEDLQDKATQQLNFVAPDFKETLDAQKKAQDCRAPPSTAAEGDRYAERSCASAR